MSVQVAGRCYASEADGLPALCASMGLNVQPVSGGAQSVECSQIVDGTQIQVKTGWLANGASSWSFTTKAITPSWQPCALLDYSDGLAIGWGIAAAWIAAFAVMYMSRAARGG